MLEHAAFRDDRPVVVSTSNPARVARETRLWRSPRADHRCSGLPSTWGAFDHVSCQSHLVGVPQPPPGGPTEIHWPNVPLAPSNPESAPLATPGSPLFRKELDHPLRFSKRQTCVSLITRQTRSSQGELRGLRLVHQSLHVRRIARAKSKCSSGDLFVISPVVSDPTHTEGFCSCSDPGATKPFR
jgi:hypothetical protein